MVDRSFWRGKRVFLTGATGFKGSWLSLWLNDMGARVTGYSLPPATAPSLFLLAGIGETIEHKDGDICDYNQLQEQMVQSDPDIVIHMAAQALVRESYRDPLGTYRSNVIGTANVLESIRKCDGVKAVVVVTTDKCYENKEWEWGYRENDTLGGYDPYSSSKACAELVTAAYRRSFLSGAGVAAATARAGNVIGGGDWAKDRLVPDCLRAIEKKEKIIIRSPKAVRPWQHVLEPLSGYLGLAEKLYAEGGTWAASWNFGPEDSQCISVEQIVERVCGLLGGSYEIQENKGPHEAGFLKLDASKARKYLGWQTLLTAEDTIQWIVQWHKAYLAGDDVQKTMAAQIKKYMERRGW